MWSSGSRIVVGLSSVLHGNSKKNASGVLRKAFRDTKLLQNDCIGASESKFSSSTAATRLEENF
jgi:hypothetical protein